MQPHLGSAHDRANAQSHDEHPGNHMDRSMTYLQCRNEVGSLEQSQLADLVDNAGDFRVG